MVQGTLEAADLTAGGVGIASLTAEAEQVDRERMRFSADARLAIGTLASASGELARLDDGFAATLASLSLRQPGIAATLTAPATVTVRGGAVELTPLALDFGTGSLTAQGRIDEAFDVDVAIRAMPLALANTVRPDLGLAGTVDGTARITGPRASPDARFQVSATGVVSANTRSAGLPPVTVEARGTTSDGRLNLDATVGAANGLSARARGAVPLGPGNIDLTVDLGAFPLALVDRVAGNRGPARHRHRAGARHRAARRPGGALQPRRPGDQRGGDAGVRPAGARADRERRLPRAGADTSARRG